MKQSNKIHILTSMSDEEFDSLEEESRLERIERENFEAEEDDVRKISQTALVILGSLAILLFFLLSGCSYSDNKPFDFRYEAAVKEIKVTNIPEECIYLLHNGKKILAPCNKFEIYHVLELKTIRIDKTLVHPNSKILNEPSSNND